MYEYRKYLLLAFLVFAMFTTIGVISTHYDLDFVKLILGEDYVNQTLENIKKAMLLLFTEADLTGEVLLELSRIILVWGLSFMLMVFSAVLEHY